MPPNQNQNGSFPPQQPRQPAPHQPYEPGQPGAPVQPLPNNMQPPALHYQHQPAPQAQQPAEPQYPQQPGIYVQQPQDAANPYSFFLDGPQSGKQAGSYQPAGNGSSTLLKRILIAGGGLAVLLMAGIVGYSLLLSAPDNSTRLLAIANDQQELIRVSKLGNASIDSDSLKNFSHTTSLSITSSQKELLTYIQAGGTKVDPKKLTLSKNAKVDDSLKSAEASNTYDTTYTSVIQSSLTKYETKLSQAKQAATTNKEKELLEKQHTTALLLLKQIAQPTP